MACPRQLLHALVAEAPDIMLNVGAAQAAR